MVRFVREIKGYFVSSLWLIVSLLLVACEGSSVEPSQPTNRPFDPASLEGEWRFVSTSPSPLNDFQERSVSSNSLDGTWVGFVDLVKAGVVDKVDGGRIRKRTQFDSPIVAHRFYMVIENGQTSLHFPTARNLFEGLQCSDTLHAVTVEDGRIRFNSRTEGVVTDNRRIDITRFNGHDAKDQTLLFEIIKVSDQVAAFGQAHYLGSNGTEATRDINCYSATMFSAENSSTQSKNTQNIQPIHFLLQNTFTTEANHQLGSLFFRAENKELNTPPSMGTWSHYSFKNEWIEDINSEYRWESFRINGLSDYGSAYEFMAIDSSTGVSGIDRVVFRLPDQ